MSPWRFGFMFSSLMLLSLPQIIQTEGSYSFLLCGMIIACIGFILFIGLLLFHRMHRNYLTGIISTSTLIHCHHRFVFFRLLLNISHFNFLCVQTGTTKKTAMVEEPATEQNGSAKPEQKEESESSWERRQLCFVLYWLLEEIKYYNKSIIEEFECSAKVYQMNDVQIYFYCAENYICKVNTVVQNRRLFFGSVNHGQCSSNLSILYCIKVCNLQHSI